MIAPILTVTLTVLLCNVPCVLCTGNRLGLALLPECPGLASHTGWHKLFVMNVQRARLTPSQYYLSGLLGFLIIEMLANWGRSLQPFLCEFQLTEAC